jgi:phage gp36-like protein
MAYLNVDDYLLHIQDVNIQQIINSNEAVRDQANLLAVAEARSYLIQKYDIDLELAKTGSDRDAQMLSTVIDISLFHLHSRIAPRNIPELRQMRYDNAIMWLNQCAKGEVTPALEKINPLQGNRIRFGGNTKNQNTY